MTTPIVTETCRNGNHVSKLRFGALATPATGAQQIPTTNTRPRPCPELSNSTRSNCTQAQ
jgi:hypothetical protein